MAIERASDPARPLIRRARATAAARSHDAPVRIAVIGLALLLVGLALAASAARADDDIRRVRTADGDRLLVARDAFRQVLDADTGQVEQQLTFNGHTQIVDFAGADDAWYVSGYEHINGLHRLFVLRGNRAGVYALPRPTAPVSATRADGASEPLQLGPVLFTDRNGLHGAAWLIGAHVQALGVYVADWDGRSWSTPVEISPAGAGSQLAPAAAVLADGTWLLAWSAHDGVDDEIHYSLRDRDGLWRAPAKVERIDDRTPDITPAVVALPDGGALLAWSAYDGRDYRLQISRLETGAADAARWSAPRTPDAVGRGAVFPRFETAFAASGDGAYLLTRAVAPAAWTLLHLADDGTTRRAAQMTTDALRRPLPIAQENGVLLRWWMPPEASATPASALTPHRVPATERVVPWTPAGGGTTNER
ncbi:MAG: sialidase family protein [Acidobacteriota bacterium]